MAASINAAELTPDQRRELGVRMPKQTEFSKEECRAWAFKVMATIANLSRAERARVLAQAVKLNKV